jgi:hypothetical protein
MLVHEVIPNAIRGTGLVPWSLSVVAPEIFMQFPLKSEELWATNHLLLGFGR